MGLYWETLWVVISGMVLLCDGLLPTTRFVDAARHRDGKIVAVRRRNWNFQTGSQTIPTV